MRTITVFLTVVFVAAAGLAQQEVPPPPKPPDNGPSLEVTMKIIQDKMNDQGDVEYVGRLSGGATRRTHYIISGSVAASATCPCRLP
jgi:hypothetical protein